MAKFCKDGTPFDVATSAMQKSIRRGLVPEAAYFANALHGTFYRYVWKRLVIIACEDIGMANTMQVEAVLIGKLMATAAGTYKTVNPLGQQPHVDLLIQTVSDMARSPKSQECNDFPYWVLTEVYEGRQKMPESLTFNQLWADMTHAMMDGREVDALLHGLALSDGWTAWLWMNLAEFAVRAVGDGHVSRLLALLRNEVLLQMADYGSYEWNVLGLAVLLLCRSDKDKRTYDLIAQLEEMAQRREAMKPPDAALDRHTMPGRNMGRGKDWRHWIEEGRLLVNEAYVSKYDVYGEGWDGKSYLDDRTVDLIGGLYQTSDQKMLAEITSGQMSMFR